MVKVGLAVLASLCWASLCPAPSWAEELELRGVYIDIDWSGIAVLSLLDDGQEPIPLGDQPVALRIELAPPEGQSEWEPIAVSLGVPRLVTLADSSYPYRIVALLPNGNDFHALRSLLRDALSVLPARDDIHVQVGIYDDTVRWLPEVTTTQLGQLEENLNDESNLNAHTQAWDTWTAIAFAYRTQLRRQAREAETQDLVHFFLLVAPADSVETQPAVLEDRTRLGLDNLGGPDMADVSMLTIVYDAGGMDGLETETDGEAFSYLRQLTPTTGTDRVAVGESGIRHALRQAVDEIRLTTVWYFRMVRQEEMADTVQQVHVVLDRHGERLVTDSTRAYFPPIRRSRLSIRFWNVVRVSSTTAFVLALIHGLLRRPRATSQKDASGAQPKVAEEQNAQPE